MKWVFGSTLAGALVAAGLTAPDAWLRISLVAAAIAILAMLALEKPEPPAPIDTPLKDWIPPDPALPGKAVHHG